MSRPLRAEISLSALQHNYQFAKQRAPGSRAFAVVKANAYGHGVERVAKALRGADGFATLEIDSAVRLRALGITQPILMLEGFFAPAELQVFAQYGLWSVVHNAEQIDILAAAQLEKPIDVFVKLNTGMNRLGFSPAAYRAAVARIASLPQAGKITLMTHFARADEKDGTEAAHACFRACAEGFDYPASLANSAATIDHSDTHGAWIRPGIMLYGATPYADRSARAIGLQPVMRLKSELIAVQDLKPGEAVGYGAGFRADRPRRIGIVACGYADGYPRIAKTGTPIGVEGVRTRILGRVSMDMIIAEITNIPSAHIGSPVELWGELIPVDEVAHGAGTVGYELLCAVAARVPVVDVE
jgi:alanine racemase